MFTLKIDFIIIFNFIEPFNMFKKLLIIISEQP
jgi:hypothetical protein